MPFLAGKRLLVTGMLSNRSIAYGIAVAAHREGAQLAFTCQGERVRERTVDLAREFGAADRVFDCDVASDEQIAQVFSDVAQHWDSLDGLVHAIAFAPREALAGDYLDNATREAFHVAHDISAYSLTAMAKAALPLMLGRAGSILTLSYLGAERAIPNYNVMGVAKAALEANVRYLAASLGPRGIRVNALSAGPIKTLAAAGIGGFGKILAAVEQTAPLRRNVTIGDVGNAAAFYLSDLAAGITGEVTYVDSGYNIIGMPVA
jgi:enoyl-[acyl-carrier protein] reductase I